MRRKLINALVGLSLLGCILIAGIWIRSFWYFDGLTFGARDGAVWMVHLHKGFLIIHHASEWQHPAVLARVQFNSTGDAVEQGTYLDVGVGSITHTTWRWPTIDYSSGRSTYYLITHSGTAHGTLSLSPTPVPAWRLVAAGWPIVVALSFWPILLLISRIHTRWKARRSVCVGHAIDRPPSQG